MPPSSAAPPAPARDDVDAAGAAAALADRAVVVVTMTADDTAPVDDDARDIEAADDAMTDDRDAATDALMDATGGMLLDCATSTAAPFCMPLCWPPAGARNAGTTIPAGTDDCDVAGVATGDEGAIAGATVVVVETEAAPELGPTEEGIGAAAGVGVVVEEDARTDAGIDAAGAVVEAGAATDTWDVGAAAGMATAAGVVTAADVEDGSAGTTGAEGWTPRPSVGSGTSPLTSQTPAVNAGQGGGVLLGT